jgi:hypothetical protein
MTACVIGMKASWKRPGSRYRSGRSPDCLKMKNPKAAAVKREAEEDWGMSYLSTTDTVTLTSDTPAILTIVPETWTVNSS